MRHREVMFHRPSARSRRRSRRPSFEALEGRSLLATITVTGTGDTIANDGVVTLREAITAANTNADPSGDTAQGDPGPDTIAFRIPGAGVHTVNLTSALPTITDPVVIDGYTQPLSSPNTLPDGDDAVLLIELNRGNLTVNGLTITAGNSTVRGLVINRNISSLSNAIEMSTAGGNRIEGNFLGLDPTGTADVAEGFGVHDLGAADNTIGGTTPAARNLISGTPFGILIEGGGATRNLVQGNFIGTNADGTARLSGGAVLIDDAPSNTIGGTTPGARNVITGHPSSNAAVLVRNARATGNLVQGNFIGIDVTGTISLGTEPVNDGVDIDDASSNTIGGTTAGARNVISGKHGSGILIEGGEATASNNLVQGNFIGTDANGMAAVPNLAGVTIAGRVFGNTIGGTTHGARNIISGNDGTGVLIELNQGGVPGHNVVQGNFIGSNILGAPLGNSGRGVFLTVASGVGGNTIGGTAAGAGNVIAFNGLTGVIVSGETGVPLDTGNAILSNAIFANGRLGIDLARSIGDPRLDGDGPTANDPGDADDGPNNLQNFPVLTTVTSAGGSTTITGTLDSAPGTYRVEFFANDAADPSSFGEGQVFLGSADVTIDASTRDFTANLPAAVSPTQFVTATATDPEGNTSEFSQLVADLAVTSADSADSAPAGTDLSYTITVTNTGTSSPSGPVTVSDTLPARVTFISATGGVTPVQGVLTLNLGIIPIGGSTTVTIVVRPDAAAAGTTITNTATVNSTVSDPDAADNSTTATTAVNAASAVADLAVTIAEAPDPVHVGQEVTYTVTVTNNGPDPATGATLTDTLDAGAAFISATGGAIPSNGLLTFDLGTLGGGADATVSVVVVPVAAGRLTIKVEAKANEADAVAANNAHSLATVVSRVATSTTIAASTTTATSGEAVTFVVSVAHPPGPGAGPTGPVTLRDGNTDLGTAPLDAGGTATFAIPDLALGSHAITASYAGDTRFDPSDGAAVTVRVDPVPSGVPPATPGGPLAVPDEYRMLARTRLTVSIPEGVLQNDLGADGRPAQARLVQRPGHGRLVFLPDGTFRYVPRANFQGTDNFTYVARDRRGDSAPTVVRIRVESLRRGQSMVIVPGESADAVALRFIWRRRDARFNDELGLIRVDGADGSIRGIRPGDPRYLSTAAAAGRMRVVFHSGESAGISRVISLRGGERFVVYLVQDRSTAAALAQNPEDRPGRRPRVFYADPAANPDRFDHVRVGERDGGLSLAWEDLLGGGDRDYNDMVLTIRAIRLEH